MGICKKIQWTDADVRCPFFVSGGREARSIVCEGFEGGMDSISRFRTLLQKDRHMGRFCVGAFERCPLYRCIYQNKYEDT